MSDTNDDHAQVGALLARCEEYSLTPHWYKNENRYEVKGWIARLRVSGRHSNRWCTEKGPTQHAAIRAAVEAAEQGVQS